MSQQHVTIINPGPNSIRVIRAGVANIDIAPSTTGTTLVLEAEMKLHPLDENGNDLAGGPGED